VTLHACAKGKEWVLLKAAVKRQGVKLYIPAPEDPNTGRFFECTLPLGIDVVVAHIELR
jgi:hypothetical protein